MLNTKAQLKAIGDAIRQSKFEDALEQASLLVEREKNNYQGYGCSFPSS
jgi:hypothetical protein